MSYDAPPPSGYGANPYGNPAAAGTNTKAIWALVLGILGLVCCGFFAGIPAIILGNLAKGEIKNSRQGGSGMATAGVVLGCLAIALGVLNLILVSTGHFYFHFNSSSN